MNSNLTPGVAFHLRQHVRASFKAMPDPKAGTIVSDTQSSHTGVGLQMRRLNVLDSV